MVMLTDGFNPVKIQPATHFLNISVVSSKRHVQYGGFMCSHRTDINFSRKVKIPISQEQIGSFHEGTPFSPSSAIGISLAAFSNQYFDVQLNYFCPLEQ